jgi:hypothetical protein
MAAAQSQGSIARMPLRCQCFTVKPWGIIVIIVACIAVAIALAVGMVLFRNWRDDAAGSIGRPISSTVIAPPDAEILVSGWSASDLAKIISDFGSTYSVPAEMSPSAEPLPGGVFRIGFPRGVAADQFIFLVNYLNYPNGFDLKSHQLTIVGKLVLRDQMGLPDSRVAGRHARVYVPKGDDQYDQVYIRIDSDAAYRIPFSNLSWHRETDPRLTAAAAAL